MITLTLTGYFKPYTRMTQRSMHCNPQAQAYLSSKMAIGFQARQQLNGQAMIPRGIPLAVDIRITHPGGFHNRDLDNEAKAILDGLQGIVFEDDRWVDILIATRAQGDQALVRVTIKPLPERSTVDD